MEAAQAPATKFPQQQQEMQRKWLMERKPRQMQVLYTKTMQHQRLQDWNI